MYYLTVREGVRERPAKVDSVYITYKGNLIDGTVFDDAQLPVWFDLTSVVPGFREGVSTIGAGEYIVNEDGTLDFFNYGQTIFFMPSGLGYYSRAQGSVPKYAPLIFSVSLFTTNPSDHDGDGILSALEDVDGDGNPFNDDTDGDGTANMYDRDDDGDGINTVDELDTDGDGVYDDTDNDGIPDYLDAD
jgi:FKBP-type peptidyl-prolyl cis-trans isomerase FkpA